MEKGLRFPGIGSLPTFLASGTFLLWVGVPFRPNVLQGACTEAQDPLELNLPLSWVWFILYCRTYKPVRWSSSLYHILFFFFFVVDFVIH